MAKTKLPVPPKRPLPKLGKLPPRIDPRTFQLRKYLRKPAAVPTPPEEISYVVRVPGWPMLLNDQLGDCVIAAMGHMVQQWTFFSTDGSAMQTMTDAEALAAYEAIGGYVPGDSSTDQGADMLTALNYWRNTGIQVGGSVHKIGGFVAVDPTNLLEVRQAIWLFGNLFMGVQLPVSAQGANDWTVPDGGIYSAAGAPGGWGGHCIPSMAESPETLTCITWAERLKMSHNFFGDYCDEAYAVLSQDWFGGGISPSSFNMKQLEADLVAL
jgi:hypothetical protein